MKKKAKKKKILKKRNFWNYYWRFLVLCLPVIISVLVSTVCKIPKRHQQSFPYEYDYTEMTSLPVSKDFLRIFVPTCIGYPLINELLSGKNSDVFSFDTQMYNRINFELCCMTEDAEWLSFPDSAFLLSVDEWKYDAENREYYLENVFFQTSERHKYAIRRHAGENPKYIECMTEIPDEWTNEYIIYGCRKNHLIHKAWDFNYFEDFEAYTVTAEEIYVKDNVSRLGKYRLIYRDSETGDETVIAESDDTPENIEEYERIEGDFCFVDEGTDPESETLKKIKAYKDKKRYVDIPFEDCVDFFRRTGSFRMPENERQPIVENNYSWNENKYEITLFGMYAPDECSVFTQTDFYTKCILLPILIDWILMLVLFSAVLSGILSHRYSRIYNEQQKAQYRRTLTNTLAHDLKSPLTAAQGYAENLLENTNPDKQQYYTERIVENICYTNQLIGDVLKLAKIEENDDELVCEKTDIAKILREMLKSFTEEFDKRKISLELDEKSFVYKVNDAMFRQIAVNLTDNIIKYTSDNGKICMEITEESLILKNTYDGTLKYSSAELMQPFVKGDASRSSRKGSGIGLAIVKQLADCQKMKLEVSSADGEFSVKIIRSTKKIK